MKTKEKSELQCPYCDAKPAKTAAGLSAHKRFHHTNQFMAEMERKAAETKPRRRYQFKNRTSQDFQLASVRPKTKGRVLDITNMHFCPFCMIKLPTQDPQRPFKGCYHCGEKF